MKKYKNRIWLFSFVGVLGLVGLILALQFDDKRMQYLMLTIFLIGIGGAFYSLDRLQNIKDDLRNNQLNFGNL